MLWLQLVTKVTAADPAAGRDVAVATTVTPESVRQAAREHGLGDSVIALPLLEVLASTRGAGSADGPAKKLAGAFKGYGYAHVTTLLQHADCRRVLEEQRGGMHKKARQHLPIVCAVVATFLHVFFLHCRGRVRCFAADHCATARVHET